MFSKHFITEQMEHNFIISQLKYIFVKQINNKQTNIVTSKTYGRTHKQPTQPQPARFNLKISYK